jgi:hypothetical protein
LSILTPRRIRVLTLARSMQVFAWQNNYCTKSVKPVAEVVEPLEAVTVTV